MGLPDRSWGYKQHCPRMHHALHLFSLFEGMGHFVLWDPTSTSWHHPEPYPPWPRAVQAGAALAELRSCKDGHPQCQRDLWGRGLGVSWTRKAAEGRRGALSPLRTRLDAPIHRLYPVGIFVERKLCSDLILQNYHIPAGVSETPQLLLQTPNLFYFSHEGLTLPHPTPPPICRHWSTCNSTAWVETPPCS